MKFRRPASRSSFSTRCENRVVLMLRALFMIGIVVDSSLVLRSQDDVARVPHNHVYQVEYSSRLNLSSASEIGRHLQASFADGTAHPAGADNCTQLFAKCGPALQGDCSSSSTSDRDIQAQKATMVDCLILQQLQSAKPSTKSHVAKLSWDEHILSLLPPQLAINISAESIAKAKAAASHGKGWLDFDKSATASGEGLDQIAVQGNGFVERLILWGRGDFNGDGMEDLLIQSLDTLTPGTYRNTRLFILTRKTPSGKLAVVRVLLQ